MQGVVEPISRCEKRRSTFRAIMDLFQPGNAVRVLPLPCQPAYRRLRRPPGKRSPPALVRSLPPLVISPALRTRSRGLDPGPP